MSIFNSLGSNYNIEFVKKVLFATSKKENTVKLEKLLGNKYKGEAIVVHKGREALRLALRATKLKGEQVGICGFTCFAVYEAIVKEGFKPLYFDIGEDDLNFTYNTLVKKYSEFPDMKVLVVQNTLGYPCEVEKIAEFCKEKDIILIEDLAHSIGARYGTGSEAGTIGDFVALSFSQDKMIDAVAGGALIIRNKKFGLQNIRFGYVSRVQQRKEKLYPLMVYIIRVTYAYGVGKVIHFILKKTNMLSTPVESRNKDTIHSLPFWHSKILIDEINGLDKNLVHRRRIAAVYKKMLDRKIAIAKSERDIELSSNLRFPIIVKNRKRLIKFLKKSSIYVSDIWYDAPIAPKKYLSMTNYVQGTCPNAESISKRILNLPTHKNVSEKEARAIAERINIWLKL
jgi:perosamine synthetase